MVLELLGATSTITENHFHEARQIPPGIPLYRAVRIIPQATPMAGDFLQKGIFFIGIKPFIKTLMLKKERPPHEQVAQDEFLFTRESFSTHPKVAGSTWSKSQSRGHH